MYLEGGDTWFRDVPVPVHDYFAIEGLEDGEGDVAQLTGAEGTFADGMTLTYEGEGLYIDRLSAREPAVDLLWNSNPSFAVAVAHDGGDYRTVGSSIELGGLGRVDDRRTFLAEVLGYLAPSLEGQGVHLEMPSTFYREGDPFWLRVELVNREAPKDDLRLFVALDLDGDLYFGPSWVGFPPYLDWWTIYRLERGAEYREIIPSSIWPDVQGSANDLVFYGVLTDQSMSSVIGEVGQWVFGYGD
jgi:hypothetical protein